MTKRRKRLSPKHLKLVVETEEELRDFASSKEISKQFDWDDPTVYEWTLRMGKYGRYLLFKSHNLLFIIIPLAVPILTYLLLWLISLLSKGVAFWLGFAALLFWICLCIQPMWKTWRGTTFQRTQARHFLLIAYTAFLGTFAYVISSPASFLRSGFSSDIYPGFWEWLLFFVDNFLGVISFGTLEIFGLGFSDITPNIWYTQLVTVLFRLSILGGVITVYLQIYRLYFRVQRFQGTIKECWVRIEPLTTIGARLRREGKLDYSQPSKTMEAVSFVVAFIEKGLKERDKD